MLATCGWANLFESSDLENICQELSQDDEENLALVKGEYWRMVLTLPIAILPIALEFERRTGKNDRYLFLYIYFLHKRFIERFLNTTIAP